MSGIGSFLLLSGTTCFAGFAASGVAGGILRGLIQPLTAAMQVFALALMLIHPDLPAGVLASPLVSIPALIAGSVLGIFAFRNVSEQICRRMILVVLLVSGLLLVA